MSGKSIYLDYAAATPMDSRVLEAMKPYFTEKFYNPSANYLAAKAIKEDILDLKKTIAVILGARHSEIIHTSGGTEANNLAISGIMKGFPDKKVLVSSVEHESVLNPAKKYKSGLVPVDKSGIIDLTALEKMITDETVLISVMLANNETGSIQPVRKAAEIIKKIRKSRAHAGIDTPLYLHSDACQAPCYMDVNTNRLGLDLMTLGGGKIYGPKGSGVLFVKSGVSLQPQILGGGQQRNLRSGTENPAALAGFGKGLEIAARERKDESMRIEKLRSEFIKELGRINPQAIINGHQKVRLPHILSLTFPDVDNERLLYQLDEAGISAASGSACSASSSEPSHVLGAMGISDRLARNSLRFSFGRGMDETDIALVLQKLETLFA